MHEVLDYSIIVAETTRTLVQLVRAELEKGWEPVGSAFINERGFPAQTVVKRAKS